MEKSVNAEKSVIGMRINLNDFVNNAAEEFMVCIQDLLSHELVAELSSFSQHCGTDRLQHSINVAYYSYMMCKLLNLDYVSAARAGILHDLFLYDWRDKDICPKGNHALVHPKVALENARKITKLNKIEEDAIVKHMWPLCFSLPKYKESMIVCMADKFCATAEVNKAYYLKLKSKLAFLGA